MRNPFLLIPLLGIVTVLLFLQIGFERISQAQPDVSPPTAPVVSPTVAAAARITEASIAEKRAAVVQRREEVQTRLASASVEGATEILQSRLQWFDRLDLLYSQQASTLQQHATLANNLQQLEDRIKTFSTEGVEGEKPFSYLFLDSQRTELNTQIERLKSLDASIESARNALEQANTRLKEAQTARRVSSEQRENNLTPLIELRHENTVLEVEVAQETVRLREAELAHLLEEKRIQQKLIQHLQDRMDLIQQDVRFKEEELLEQLTVIDTQVADLDNQHKTALEELTQAAAAFEKTQQQFTARKTPILSEKVNTARAKLDLYTTKTNILLERKVRTGERKKIWQDRFDTVNGIAPYSQLQEWLRNYDEILKKLNTEEALLKRDISAKQSAVVTVETRIESQRDDPPLILELQARKQHITDEIAVLNAGLNSIEATRRVVDKLLFEIKNELNIWTWEELVEHYYNLFLQYYNYELFSIGEEESISAGELLIALSVFVIGLVVAALLSKLIGYVLLSRFQVEESIVISIRSLFFYTIVVLLFPLSLRVIQVDLTAFAFLGGALAIGFGFGSQNIFNNFISGVILLMERPVRVGDIVEVETVTGKISRIGLRSTILTTWDNQDVVIPNSYFLENRITNFTLDNWVIRSIVQVGIAYGSDTRLAQKLMRKAIDEHGLILKFPEPFVVFHHFGESSLDFRLYYWVDMKNCSRLEVDSDIRHRLNKIFKENGIEIPFPQRDLHFRSGVPFQVSMLSGQNSDPVAAPSQPPSEPQAAPDSSQNLS